MDVQIMVKDRLTHGAYDLRRGDIITVDEGLANALVRRGLVNLTAKLEDSKSEGKSEMKITVPTKTKNKGR